jgi:hypothetical protein
MHATRQNIAIYLTMLLSLLLLSCRGTGDVTVFTRTTIPERNVPFEFQGADFYLDSDEGTLDEITGLYTPSYRLAFSFRNKTPFFSAGYTVTDNDGNILIEKENVKPVKAEKRDYTYTIEDTFTDIFTHNQLHYILTIKYGNETRDYQGLLENSTIPALDEITFGPFITRYRDNSVSTSLAVTCRITNSRDVEWIRLIPPSLDSFWNIPWKTEMNSILASGTVSDQETQNQLNNGDYVLQINLGPAGTIQREFAVHDFFNNTTGPNYGLPIANELDSGKDAITLDIDLLEKVERIEIWVYAVYGDREQKLGTAKFSTASEVISKKEIRDLLIDDFGNKIKVKNNKQYEYRIMLYSKEFNGLQYLSISDKYPITFQGFLFFPF